MEHKISLFADDTPCILKDIQSLYFVFEVTDIFSKYSGLKLNIEKSMLVFIGPWKTKPNVPFNLVVQNENFNLLGIELGVNKQ